ncbi:dihydropteroate synthase [Denitratisoma sp. DHT3]|uniref:dihydropteroate synthase n=1 Tax=Denitratisoma sp. DHT3 TaxID=1981880 RepID=UPI001198B762|nr:dihydropteroate synthase [Denitratisoma sp. DHT3]QDX80655.1 dihydropteroate synthase [Denitratisoma sp. DHT3]
MDDILHCGRYRLSLKRPLVMGIVNLTDDSFSGDGCGDDAARAIAHGHRLLEEGADLLDIGGESTRPGAMPVSAQQEMDRVLPVLEGLLACGAPLSVDTAKTEVMRAALAAGADMVNDIGALTAPGALEAVAASPAGVCLMHMQGEPRTMQQSPRYGDVVAEVAAYLAGRVAAAEAAGIARERIVVDPGFGFGKTLDHNLALLRHLDALRVSGLPLLAGLSRKSMLGLLTGRPAPERVFASVAAALLAAERGAAILRVHDVAATRDALTVLTALEETSE